MKPSKPASDVDVEFIRLFFPSAEQEQFAVELARFLASIAPGRIALLRPETPLREFLRGVDSLDAAEFVLALEGVFGHEIDNRFAGDLEHCTFRELVEYGTACRNHRTERDDPAP